MNTYTFEDKTIEEAKNKALKELNINEENIIIINQTEKNGLLKKSASIELVTVDEIINYLKDSLNEILILMGIEANYEVRRRENRIEIKIFSDNNAILIGKNGRTMQSLQTILRFILKNHVASDLSVMLDVENYKEKRNRNIEYLAKKVARDVAKTKVETKLDNMNSYERRIVHNILSDNKYVYTVSEGEEPNRHVVIKPRVIKPRED